MLLKLTVNIFHVHLFDANKKRGKVGKCLFFANSGFSSKCIEKFEFIFAVHAFFIHYLFTCMCSECIDAHKET